MILFDVRCENGHVFESWFRNGAAFEALAAAGEVACPECGATRVTKALMAPHVPPKGGPVAAEKPAPADKAVQVRQALNALYDKVIRNTEDVGARFAEEARKIHHGEVDARNIRGQSTPQETRELREEGVPFHEIPVPPRRRD